MACCSNQKSEDPSEYGVCEDQESGTLLRSPSSSAGKQQNKGKVLERRLLDTIEKGEFEEIESNINPKAFKRCKSNSLLMGMKVNFELRRVAGTKGPDEERFNQLANSVEAFTTCLLDPLRSNKQKREKEFGDRLDQLLEDAIQLEQKAFFTHPVVDAEMKRKWYGREFSRITTERKRWQLLFSIWCLFDMVFCPILFAVFSLKKKQSKNQGSDVIIMQVNNEGSKNDRSVPEIYLMTLETPYFKFIRDTLSYIVLLVLHYALCLSSSTVTFSGLEWAILIFFIGRFLVEGKQINDVIQRLKQQKDSGYRRAQSKCIPLKALYIYQSDLWNRLDFLSLIFYLIILLLRVATFIMSGSVKNNRALLVCGYFYGFNTLCLTFRVIGHVLEQSKVVGTIQIALFSIVRDISVIIWQFTAAIMAFSIAITKVYMAERSFIASESDGNDAVCNKSGISCWWTIIIHMCWTVLGVSHDFDLTTSVDVPSETITRFLYAGFFIMGVILLINMLIALLSNTYQRIQDNSLREWSFKSAVTIQTYDGYDPIPVPLNIIYSVAKLLRLVKGKQKRKGRSLDSVVIDLDREYFEKHGNCFPTLVKKKHDLVVRETQGNRQMINQVLNATFDFQGRGDGRTMCPGPKMWQVHRGITVEGHHLTCEGDKKNWYGARYLKPFSPEFPHFEVTIVETGKRVMLVVGVVDEGYNTNKMPGMENGTVGYSTEGAIFDAIDNRYGIGTKGPAVASRGDRIRCTVDYLLENAQERNGKLQVPIVFTLNGRRIILLRNDQISMDRDKPLYPYIAMAGGSSVLAKLCPRENKEDEVPKIEDLDRKVTEMKESLEETNRKLDILLARLTHQDQSA